MLTGLSAAHGRGVLPLLVAKLLALVLWVLEVLLLLLLILGLLLRRAFLERHRERRCEA